MEEASNSIAVDDFTDQLKKTKFVRIWVEINYTLPLKLGVLIREKIKFSCKASSICNVVCFWCG